MIVTSSSARHLLLQLKAPASLPGALHAHLRDEVVLAGWVHATGVLESVELRVVGRDAAHAIRGPLQVVSLTGSVGLSGGDVSCGMSAVLARSTETGIETLAGEILSARVIALDVTVTAFDDASATRSSKAHGIALLETVTPIAAAASSPSSPAIAAAAEESAPRLVAAPAPAPSAPAMVPPPAASSSPSLSGAMDASSKAAAAKPPQAAGSAPMPIRPARPQVDTGDEIYPNEGDIVEHFAFGRCDVVKSDGDRLHLRLGKDGRIKEIALEMLKVTPLDPVEGASGKHFKLDRKL